MEADEGATGLRRRWQGSVEVDGQGKGTTMAVGSPELHDDEDETGPPPPLPPTPSAKQGDDARKSRYGESEGAAKNAVSALINIVRQHPVGVPVLLVAVSPFLLLLLPVLLLALAGGTIYVVALQHLLSPCTASPPIIQAEELDETSNDADGDEQRKQKPSLAAEDSDTADQAAEIEISSEVTEPVLLDDSKVGQEAATPSAGPALSDVCSRGSLEQEVVFIYGSQTGTASDIARSLHAEALSKGLLARVMAMDEVDRATFPTSCVLVVVTSSTGDGDPPDNCARFFHWLSQRGRPAGLLEGVAFAVVGLGDSNYTSFMAVPRAVRRRLRDLGGVEFAPYVEADEVEGIEEKVEEWRGKHLWAPVAAILRKAEQDKNAQEPAARSEEAKETSSLPNIAASVAEVAASAAAPAGAPLPALEGVAPLPPCRITLRWLPASAAGEVAVGRDLRDRVQVEMAEHAILANSAPEAFVARVTDARYLTSSTADRRVLHVELDVGGRSYCPGDSVAVQPENAADLVERLLDRLSVVGDDMFFVEARDGSVAAGSTASESSRLLPHIPRPCSVHELFTSCLDITGVPRKSLLRILAESCSDPSESYQLKLLSSRTGKLEYKSEVLEGQPGLLDILERFKSCTPPLEALVDALPPLVPRLYSITCAPEACPGRIQVAFTVVEYTTSMGYCKRGVATTWLERLVCDFAGTRRGAGSVSVPPARPLRVHLKGGGNFRLPDDLAVPIIMIGPGTGVAPFRGFLQRRRARLQERKAACVAAANGGAVGGVGEAWLFFGNRRSSEDFLYGEDLRQLEEDGTLTRLLLAWSREGPSKVYVQDRMEENAADIHRLVAAEGASVFVCGDGASMAKDVQAALVKILAQQGGKTAVEAAKMLDGLVKQGRYVRDIWS